MCLYVHNFVFYFNNKQQCSIGWIAHEQAQAAIVVVLSNEVEMKSELQRLLSLLFACTLLRLSSFNLFVFPFFFFPAFFNFLFFFHLLSLFIFFLRFHSIAHGHQWPQAGKIIYEINKEKGREQWGKVVVFYFNILFALVLSYFDIQRKMIYFEINHRMFALM